MILLLKRLPGNDSGINGEEKMAGKKFLLLSLVVFCFVMICFFWMQSLAYG